MTHYWTEHAEPGGTSCEAATTTGAAKVAAGIDCLDGGADIVKRDNDDDVIDDDHDTIIFDTSGHSRPPATGRMKREALAAVRSPSRRATPRLEQTHEPKLDAQDPSPSPDAF